MVDDGTSSERDPDMGVDQAVHDEDDGGEAGDDVGKRSSSEM